METRSARGTTEAVIARRHLSFWRLLSTVSVSVLAACPGPLQQRAPIDHWLLCDECVDGELDSVVALASQAVPSLANALLQGPPSERRENMRRQFTASYARVVARVGPGGVSLSESKYVAHYIDNYVAIYHSRSATALGEIGTDDAFDALRQALAQDSLYRPQVVEDIRRALADSMEVIGGNNQIGPVGATLPVDPSVLVTDDDSNPVRQLSVTFTAQPGNGIVSGGKTRTDDATGIASAKWTLGPAPGLQVLRVTTGDLSATFQATADSVAGPVLTLNAGQSQSASVGTVVPIAPSVLVTDGRGSPAPGVTVNFAVTFGGGSVAGATTVSDTIGIATVGSWTLGPDLGRLNTLRAAAPGATDSVTFSAVGTRQFPASIAIADGNNQTATVGTSVATPPSVLVRDASGDPLPGVPVAFYVLSGGGSIMGTVQLTNSDGVATVGSWTLGPIAGANALRATTLNLPSVTFSATAI